MTGSREACKAKGRGLTLDSLLCRFTRGCLFGSELSYCIAVFLGKGFSEPLGHKWETGSMLRVWSQTLDFSSKNAARLAGIFQLRRKGTGKMEKIAGFEGPALVLE